MLEGCEATRAAEPGGLRLGFRSRHWGLQGRDQQVQELVEMQAGSVALEGRAGTR